MLGQCQSTTEQHMPSQFSTACSCDSVLHAGSSGTAELHLRSPGKTVTSVKLKFRFSE